MRRPAVTLLFTVVLYLAAAPAPSGAIPGSIVVSQLLLYDNPDGCTHAPCGFYTGRGGRCRPGSARAGSKSASGRASRSSSPTGMGCTSSPWPTVPSELAWLHFRDLWSGSRPVRLPYNLGYYGFLDQLTWLP